MKIGEAVQEAAVKLAGKSDAPQLDARWLMLHVLEQEEDSWLITHGDEKLDDKKLASFEEMLGRRDAGEPLAYILGEWEFYGRRFKVTPDVLVPRPLTEDLVEEALRVIASMARQYGGRPLAVADIGTGSGIIAITLALETGVNVVATDQSPTALNIARENAKRHGVAKKITFLQGDMLKPLEKLDVDLIVSNPPYLPAEALAKAGCPANTAGLCFEPKIALDGGEDGQDYINQLKKADVPTVVETTGGKIEWLNK